MDRFRNKYRIPSARAQWWNYGWSGVYFITICTAIREHFFGEIQNGNMILSKTGVISDILWHEIPTHAPNVELGDFVVMPNHIHGILIFNQPNDNIKTNVVTGFDKDDGNKNVKTGHALSLPNNDSPPGQKRFQNIGKNTVSSIVGSYKAAVTKHANRLGLENGWQTRFHDYIIRNDAEYQRISNYIISNPENWENDKYNSDND